MGSYAGGVPLRHRALPAASSYAASRYAVQIRGGVVRVCTRLAEDEGRHSSLMVVVVYVFTGAGRTIYKTWDVVCLLLLAQACNLFEGSTLIRQQSVHILAMWKCTSSPRAVRCCGKEQEDAALGRGLFGDAYDGNG